ncbi:MAG: hypothetical protein AAFR61_31795, partial [Bacteroidota bacterium]
MQPNQFSPPTWRLFFMTACLFLTSCQLAELTDQIEPDTWEPSLAIPVFDTEIDLSELLNGNPAGENLQTENGLFVLIYRDSVRFEEVPVVAFAEDITQFVIDTLSFIPAPFSQGEIVQRIVYKTGTLDYTLFTSLTGSYTLEVEIPDATQAGQTLKGTHAVTGPGTFTFSLPMQGYDLVLDSGFFRLRHHLYDQSNGMEVDVDSLEVGMNNSSFYYLEGLFSDYPLNLPATDIEIPIFETLRADRIKLADPELTFTFENSFGFPVKLQVDEFSLFDAAGNKRSLQESVLSQGLDLNYPTVSEAGTTAITDYTLDKNNSNLQEVFSVLPTLVRYDMDAFASGKGPNETPIFLTDTSDMAAYIEMRLPLFMETENLVLLDTFDQTFDWPETDEVKNIEFKLVSDNGLPLDMDLQMLFLDGQGQVVDSLKEGN